MKLIALEWMSLDGVTQSPSYADEDAGDGFRHGGWHRLFLEPSSLQWIVDGVAGADAYLLGRGTYDNFAAHWPKAGPDEQMLAGPLNSRPKYVATSRPLDPAWTNARRLDAELGEAVGRIKATGPGTLALIGSPKLAQSLFALGLIDELRVMIDPIVIGSGKRLFGNADNPMRFDLASCVPVSTGAMLATYLRPAA
ncbi:MAG: dihydrofolate reductase family protein [Devosia sp.]